MARFIHIHDGACPTNGGSVIQDHWMGTIQSLSSLTLSLWVLASDQSWCWVKLPHWNLDCSMDCLIGLVVYKERQREKMWPSIFCPITHCIVFGILPKKTYWKRQWNYTLVLKSLNLILSYGSCISIILRGRHLNISAHERIVGTWMYLINECSLQVRWFSFCFKQFLIVRWIRLFATGV